MIKSVRVINDRQQEVEIVLAEAEPDHGLLITSIDGLGPPKANISKNDIVTRDGVLFNSSKMSGRTITITFLLNMAPNIEATRHRIYKYFPIKRPIKMYITTDVRTLTCVGYVEAVEPDIFSDKETCVVTLFCPDPYLYLEVEVNSFLGSIPKFEFDITNGYSNESTTTALTIISETQNNINQTIEYNGDFEVGFKIKMHVVGTINGDIKIYNADTKEFIGIDIARMSALTAGDDIIISTEYGNKTLTLIRNGTRYNRLSTLLLDSTWLTMKPGSNSFTYTIDSGYSVSNLQVAFEYLEAYGGI